MTNALTIKNMHKLDISEVVGSIELPTSVYGNRGITLDVFLEWCTKNGIPSNTKLSELEDLLISELELLPTYETLDNYTTFEDAAEMIAQVQLDGGEVDLSIYAHKSDVDTSLLGKVDKVGGKGLSEADFTNVEKDKLLSIEIGAQVNPDQAFYQTLLLPISTELVNIQNKVDTKATSEDVRQTIQTVNTTLNNKIDRVEAEGKFALASEVADLVPKVDLDSYKVQQSQLLNLKADKTQLTPLATKQYVDDAIAALPPIVSPTIQINGTHFALGDIKFAILTVETVEGNNAFGSVDFSFANFTDPPTVFITPISPNAASDTSANNATWACLLKDSVTKDGCIIRTKSADSAGLLAAMVSVNKPCQVNIFAIGI